MEGEQSEIVGELLANEQEWNGVGIVLYTDLKEDLISVSRKSDPVMSIELGLDVCLCSTSGLYRE